MSGVIGKGTCNGMSSTVQRKASEKCLPTSCRQCRRISLPFRKAPATLALQTKVDYLENNSTILCIHLLLDVVNLCIITTENSFV